MEQLLETLAPKLALNQALSSIDRINLKTTQLESQLGEFATSTEVIAKLDEHATKLSSVTFPKDEGNKLKSEAEEIASQMQGMSATMAGKADAQWMGQLESSIQAAIKQVIPDYFSAVGPYDSLRDLCC